jgi:uncharacterized membrane protein (GlpM family)
MIKFVVIFIDRCFPEMRIFAFLMINLFFILKYFKINILKFIVYINKSMKTIQNYFIYLHFNYLFKIKNTHLKKNTKT